MKGTIPILLLFVVFLIGCGESEYQAPDAEEVNTVKFEGIKVGPVETNEEGDKIHNIYNFDAEQKTVQVTTVCYNKNDKVIDDSDSYEMVLEGDSISGWRPDCPEETTDYQIDIEELE